MRILLIPAVLLLGAAPAADQRRDTVPPATPTGKPVSCIQTSQIRQSHVRSDSVIDFEMRGGRVYRNTLSHRCHGLGFEERFAYRTHVGQLCSVDTITVLQGPGVSAGPSCGLGKFQPVRLAKPPRRR